MKQWILIDSVHCNDIMSTGTGRGGTGRGNVGRWCYHEVKLNSCWNAQSTLLGIAAARWGGLGNATPQRVQWRSWGKKLTKPCPGFPRQAGIPKPMLNACKTSFSESITFPYLVALAEIQEMQERHTFLSKNCVGFDEIIGIPLKPIVNV